MSTRRLAALLAISLSGAFLISCQDTVDEHGTPDGSGLAFQLAQKYAPVLYTVAADPNEHCADTFDVDPYKPTGIDAFLGKTNVRMLDGGDVQIEMPAMADIATEDDHDGYAFDIYTPDPFNTGDRCQYETNYLQSGSARTVYARVVNTADETALQYFFFYYLNDYINTHEGDWEMIELLFKSGSTGDIAGEGGTPPYWAGYSQHTAGKSRPWGHVPKVAGTHPLVFVASGSHSNYFAPGNWHSEVKYWYGACDYTLGPTSGGVQRLELEPARQPGATPYHLELLGNPASDVAYLWTAFRGKWGESSWVPSFGGLMSAVADNPGLDPWWWKDELNGKPNDICTDRPVHPRKADATRRLLQELSEEPWDFRILAGDLIVIVARWLGSDVDLTITDPRMNKIDTDDQNVEFEKGDGYLIYQIKNGGPGPWHVSITGTGLPAAGEYVDLKAFDLPAACKDIDRTNGGRDSDQDFIPNAGDPYPCDWDHDDDFFADGCETLTHVCFPVGPD